MKFRRTVLLGAAFSVLLPTLLLPTTAQAAGKAAVAVKTIYSGRVDRTKKFVVKDSVSAVRRGRMVRYKYLVITINSEKKAKEFFEAQTLPNLKGKVDYKTEELLLFVWAGSGMDTLKAIAPKNGGVIQFKYTHGMTRDLRPHLALFVVKKGAKYKAHKMFKNGGNAPKIQAIPANPKFVPFRGGRFSIPKTR